MAGRPQAARGGNGILYGMISFAIISVLALGAFIWQLTQNQTLAEEARKARQSLEEAGRAPTYYQSVARNTRSNVFRVMEKDIQEMAEAITGRRETVAQAVVEDTNALIETLRLNHPDATIPEGATLFTAVLELSRRTGELEQRTSALQRDVDQLEAEKLSLAEGVKVSRDEFTEQVAELQDELELVREEKTETLSAKEEQLADAQASLEATQEELNRVAVAQQQESTLTEIEIERMSNDLDSMRKQVAETRGVVDAEDILKKADGKVLRAIPGSDVVYVNVGEMDRIKPGQTFEVFSPRGEDDGARGKASLEVATVDTEVSECRVTRTVAGRPIVEGDIIVNLAYERSRKPKFVIRGEFDLNYDEQSDPEDYERIAAMIREWGGQVVDEFNESTDYVVIGTGPRVPEFRSGVPVSEVMREIERQQLTKLDEFRELIDTASSRYIPVLTQSQFLFLTGFTDRNPVLR